MAWFLGRAKGLGGFGLPKQPSHKNVTLHCYIFMRGAKCNNVTLHFLQNGFLGRAAIGQRGWGGMQLSPSSVWLRKYIASSRPPNPRTADSEARQNETHLRGRAGQSRSRTGQSRSRQAQEQGRAGQEQAQRPSLEWSLGSCKMLTWGRGGMNRYSNLCANLS